MTCVHCPQDDTFVWSKQWYPLAAVEDLNPSKPFAIKLLGESATPWTQSTSMCKDHWQNEHLYQQKTVELPDLYR